jgi:hypothetical protein
MKSNPKKYQLPGKTTTMSFSVANNENEPLWVVAIESCGRVGVSRCLLKKKKQRLASLNTEKKKNKELENCTVFEQKKKKEHVF